VGVDDVGLFFRAGFFSSLRREIKSFSGDERSDEFGNDGEQAGNFCRFRVPNEPSGPVVGPEKSVLLRRRVIWRRPLTCGEGVFLRAADDEARVE